MLFAAFYSVWALRTRFLRALAWPLAAYVVFDLSMAYRSDLGLLNLLATIVDCLIYTVVAVTTHRLVLLGRGSVGPWGLTRWTARESSFFLHWVLLLLLMIASTSVVVLLLSLLPPFAMAAGAWVCLLFIATRFSLLFPAIAVGDRTSLKLAWRLSAKHQWQLFVVVVAFPLLLGVPLLLTTLGASIWNALAFVLLSNLMVVFTISAVSMAYREVTQSPDKV
ncbi:MAG: hypothetical protein AAGJ52_10290 [Pseudomonadota bacterium]